MKKTTTPAVKLEFKMRHADCGCVEMKDFKVSTENIETYESEEASGPSTGATSDAYRINYDGIIDWTRRGQA